MKMHRYLVRLRRAARHADRCAQLRLIPPSTRSCCRSSRPGRRSTTRRPRATRASRRSTRSRSVPRRSRSSIPTRAEALIWEGIIESSYAGAKGGLGALGLAKEARGNLEAALEDRPDGARRLRLHEPRYALLQGARLPDRLRRPRQGAQAAAGGAEDQSERHRPELLLRRLPVRARRVRRTRCSISRRRPRRRRARAAKWPTRDVTREIDALTAKVKAKTGLKSAVRRFGGHWPAESQRPATQNLRRARRRRAGVARCEGERTRAATQASSRRCTPKSSANSRLCRPLP